MGIFARRKREKYSTTMSIEELRMLDNDELRDAVSARMMKEVGRSAAGYIMDTLREIHATRHAELLREFTSENGIDLDDLGDLRIGICMGDSNEEFLYR